MVLVLGEAQRLCDTTYDGIEQLWDKEVSDTRASQGLRAAIFNKVLEMETNYDSFHILFANMSLNIKALPRRLSMMDSLKETNLPDIFEYLEPDESL